MRKNKNRGYRMIQDSTTPVLQHSKNNPFKRTRWTLTTPMRLDLPLNHSYMGKAYETIPGS